MRRLASALLAFSIAALLVLAGTTEPQHHSPRVQAAPLLQIAPAHPGFAPTLAGTEPIYFLVLGDNYRQGIEESHLTDSIHVIGLNPEKKEATIVGIPRDAWVTIPGHGDAKINEAYHFGGNKMAVATIEELTGLQMDYVAVTGFTGFRALVSEIGGVTVKLPYAIDDEHAKANFNKGKETMMGKEALSFVRARYDVPNGDFSRSENQGLFLTSMLAQMQKQMKKDPSVLLRYFASTLRNVETDVPYEELLSLAFTANEVSVKGIKNLVTPGTIGTKNGQSVVLLTSGATKIFNKMKNDGLA